MSEKNYASLEASKRLKDAGIVLETESTWLFKENPYKTFPDGECVRDWALIRTNSILYEKEKHDHPAFVISVPSMAEVWRELSEYIEHNNYIFELVLLKDKNVSSAAYSLLEQNINHTLFESANPADALIDLLIWLKKKGLY